MPLSLLYRYATISIYPALALQVVFAWLLFFSASISDKIEIVSQDHGWTDGIFLLQKTTMVFSFVLCRLYLESAHGFVQFIIVWMRKVKKPLAQQLLQFSSLWFEHFKTWIQVLFIAVHHKTSFKLKLFESNLHQNIYSKASLNPN